MANVNGTEVKIHFLAAFNDVSKNADGEIGNYGSSGIIIEDYDQNTGKKFWGMIDTGCSGAADKKLFSNYFKTHKIKELEYVLLTHYHGDHVGGVKTMLRNNMVKIKRLILPMNKTVLRETKDLGSLSQEEYDKAIAQINTITTDFKEYQGKTGNSACSIEFFKLSKVAEMQDSFNKLGQCQYTFYNTSPKASALISADAPKLDKFCLVIMLKIGNIKVLLPADIYTDTQAYLLNKLGADKLRADVMQMCHHGSKGAYRQEFVEAVQPSGAIACRNYRAGAVGLYAEKRNDLSRIYTTSQEFNKLWNPSEMEIGEEGKASIILRIQDDQILYYSRRVGMKNGELGYEHIRIPDDVQYNAVNDPPKEQSL